MSVEEGLLRLLEFMQQGGEVMWMIALLTVILWSFVFERYWYVVFGVKRDIQNELKIWQNYGVCDKRALEYLREAVSSKMQQKIDSHLNLIKTLILLCPLLGLLGTVTGMITVFDIISFDQMGDLKLMAGGISKATIPTMASMVVSISGIFAFATIKKIADSKKQIILVTFGSVGYA